MPEPSRRQQVMRGARGAARSFRGTLTPRIAKSERYLNELSESMRDEGEQTRAAAFQAAAGVSAALDNHARGLVEAAGHLGEQLDRAEATVAMLDRRVETIEEEVSGTLYASRLLGSIPVPPSELDAVTAEALDLAFGPDGPAARAGLRDAMPLQLRHGEGAVQVAAMTRSGVEEPFALQALAGVRAPSRVLVVTPTFTTLPLALAALGYDVTAMLPGDAPVEHPGVAWHAGGTAEAPEGPFEVVIALGALDGADLATADDVLREIRERLATRGVAVLSTVIGVRPGQQADTELPERVDRLLQGWAVDERVDVARVTRTVWQRSDVVLGSGLALVRARPSP